MDKKLKIGYIVNGIFAGLIVIGALLFMLLHSIVTPYIVKTIPSILFVLSGLFNFIYAYKFANKNTTYIKFAIFMLCGLFFAMLGDILLIDFFTVGAILFAIGHILFFIAFCFVNKICVKDFVVAAIIFGFALLLILIYPFDFDGMKILVIIYALIISLMLGKSIGTFFTEEKTLLKWVILIGASLFFISDLMLLMYKFDAHLEIYDWLCVMTYYPAEAILAFSVFVSLMGISFKRLNNKQKNR